MKCLCPLINATDYLAREDPYVKVTIDLFRNKVDGVGAEREVRDHF